MRSPGNREAQGHGARQRRINFENSGPFPGEFFDRRPSKPSRGWGGSDTNGRSIALSGQPARLDQAIILMTFLYLPPSPHHLQDPLFCISLLNRMENIFLVSLFLSLYCSFNLGFIRVASVCHHCKKPKWEKQFVDNSYKGKSLLNGLVL